MHVLLFLRTFYFFTICMLTFLLLRLLLLLHFLICQFGYNSCWRCVHRCIHNLLSTTITTVTTTTTTNRHKNVCGLHGCTVLLHPWYWIAIEFCFNLWMYTAVSGFGLGPSVTPISNAPPGIRFNLKPLSRYFTIVK